MTDYWLPYWWDTISDWSDCAACLEYFGTPCTGCEVPPGLLAIACLVGGGTTTVAGNCRGNQTIIGTRQTRAVERMTGLNNVQVNGTPVGRLQNLNVNVENNLNRNQR